MVVRVRVDTSALDELANLLSAEDVKVGAGTTSLGTVLKIGVFDALTQAMKFLVERSRVNAPIDTGRLRASIGAFIGQTQVVPFGAVQSFNGSRPNYRVEGTDSQIQAGKLPPPASIPEVLSGQIVATADYAFLVHETMKPAGPVQPREFENTPEGGVGGKFLQRALEHNRDAALTIMQKALTKTLQSFSTRGSKVVGKRRNIQPETALATQLAGFGQPTGSFPGQTP